MVLTMKGRSWRRLNGSNVLILQHSSCFAYYQKIYPCKLHRISFYVPNFEKVVFFCLIWFFTSNENLSVKQGRVFLGWTSTKLGWMCLAQGPQLSDAGEARTYSLSVLSQALYHGTTVLPLKKLKGHIALGLSVLPSVLPSVTNLR